MMKDISLQGRVQAVVNKYDPIGLLKMGAPDDEYLGEIEKIILMLPDVSSAEGLCEKVYGLFVEMFDMKTAGTKEDYQMLCEELYRGF